MGDFGTLTTSEERFVAAVIGAPTVRAAAEVAEVSESTAWRYLDRSHVKQAIGRRLESATRQVVCGLVDDVSAARSVLREIVDDEDVGAATRVSAARVIIQSEQALLDTVNIMARIAELEKTIGG